MNSQALFIYSSLNFENVKHKSSTINAFQDRLSKSVVLFEQLLCLVFLYEGRLD